MILWSSYKVRRLKVTLQSKKEILCLSRTDVIHFCMTGDRVLLTQVPKEVAP